MDTVKQRGRRVSLGPLVREWRHRMGVDEVEARGVHMGGGQDVAKNPVLKKIPEITAIDMHIASASFEAARY